MNHFSPLIDKLINEICILPGIGKKSAQRIAFFLLKKNMRINGIKLSNILKESLIKIKNCFECNNFSEEKLCYICKNRLRKKNLLCIVESPKDVFLFEKTGIYKGLYFVLMGHLSPIKGIGPEEIYIPKLLKKIKNSKIKEIIMAINPTIEGEATSYYILEKIKKYDKNIKISKIAYGIPIGGEIEFFDENTLACSIMNRTKIK